jgi:hypothetical protein
MPLITIPEYINKNSVMQKMINVRMREIHGTTKPVHWTLSVGKNCGVVGTSNDEMRSEARVVCNTRNSISRVV